MHLSNNSIEKCFIIEVLLTYFDFKMVKITDIPCKTRRFTHRRTKKYFSGQAGVYEVSIQKMPNDRKISTFFNSMVNVSEDETRTILKLLSSCLFLCNYFDLQKFDFPPKSLKTEKAWIIARKKGPISTALVPKIGLMLSNVVKHFSFAPVSYLMVPKWSLWSSIHFLFLICRNGFSWKYKQCS